MEVMYAEYKRRKGDLVTASQAILKGLSDDGGLFVPTQIPRLWIFPWKKLSRMTYQETAYEVIEPFPDRFYRR